MKLSELPIEKQIIEILEEQEISELYPPQAEALPYALKGENLVLSIPTASGKSLVAYLAIVHRLISIGGKAIYVVPLKALAREKYEDLKVFEKLGLKVAISTGDLDESDTRLSRYDIIVCTSEKADSILRHGIKWVDKVRVLVVDEIHLIHDPSRGPTLEVIISRFKALNPSTQIIALSATIRNARELADWLGGRLIQSDWRPVPLREGVFYKDEIKYDDGTVVKIGKLGDRALDTLVLDSITNGGQVLVFVNTRKSTVSVAHKLGDVIGKILSDEEKKGLKKLVSSIKRDALEFTSFDANLSSCVENGVAFHNAGLSSVHRRVVEQGFKNRLIKCIVATPTLAAGVNIPAQRVIIRDLWRYDQNFGMHSIPILEYKQQAGRAGRPRYDKQGEAITIAKNEEQKERIFNDYILADTEPIFSKLGNQMALRTHLLSAIATNFVDSLEGIYKFIDSTFYAYQSDVYTLRDDIDEVIDFLLSNGFIERINNDRFMSTLFGNKTSSLYIDPLSAVLIKKALVSSCDKKSSSLSFIHTVCSTPDVRSLYLSSNDGWVEDKLERYRGDFLIEPPKESSEEYEWFLSGLKTASLIEDWINEVPEEKIVSKYNVGPGDIYSLIETTEWLLHATREFARMYNFDCVSEINDLILRVHNGCKKELLNLISLKGIGRVRARALYREGFKTVNDLRGVPVKRLAMIKSIGERVAESIKNQIGESVKGGEKELSEFRKSRRKTR
ncbi:MAG: DEAD/DEAH box helicase [Candidatus Thermoplasmatota archaeon]|jgi:helicase|nr:DEAD/DEAH box helicase [Candidatus Thermoplasmatota archaeon]